MKQRAQRDYFRKLRALFQHLDISGDGLVSYEEFKSMLDKPEVKAWLSALEIDSHDLDVLFEILDDGDGQISLEEFTRGAVRVKGLAKSMDQVHVLAILKRLEQKFDSRKASDESDQMHI
mmetsp:Transcript_42608/g.92841  ORF Transcript_42608/g.92841 Transcript_42608/m.92841 type:complete len:120 (+) Transcript_42608:3-362(+)